MTTQQQLKTENDFLRKQLEEQFNTTLKLRGITKPTKENYKTLSEDNLIKYYIATGDILGSLDDHTEEELPNSYNLENEHIFIAAFKKNFNTMEYVAFFFED